MRDTRSILEETTVEAPVMPLPKKPIHRLFERAARLFPEHVAIKKGGEKTTYHDLEQRANGLARLLRDLGVAPGSFVGILAENAREVITAKLAILKAGCGFVPLDPTLPEERLRDILGEVDPPWVVAEPALLPRLAAARPAGGPPLRVMAVGADDGSPVAAPAGLDIMSAGVPRAPESPEVEDDPDARSYVYFTSGSTGRPKGIVGRLRAIDHFMRWEAELLELWQGSRVALLTTPSFDAYLRVFLPLSVGGTFYAPENRDVFLDAARLVDWLDRERIEVVHCVPTLFRSILSQSPGSERFAALRYLLMAGERILPADVARWTATFDDRVQLVNLYGPTETTITKFVYFIQPADKDLRSIPIGKPMGGAEAMVLDARNRPCPTGAVGEICIRTPFRAHGYLNRPDLDREVFVPNPLTGDTDDLVYRTGDFGRLMKDGNFEFLGRRDHQVKIRGVRIELAEVEEVLRRHPEVHDLVVVDHKDADGNAILCAFVVGGASAGAAELEELCVHFLPPAMVPSVYVPMESLPRTLSGKVDRRSLPKPAEVLSERRRTYVAPRSEREKELAGIWAEVLGLTEVGVEDNFFHLGGHSLLATRVLARVRAAFSVEVPLGLFFQEPTVAGLAAVMARILEEARGGAAPPLVRVSRDVDHLASFAQERLWFLQRLEPEGVGYNMAALVRLTGDLDLNALETSLAVVVRRHESLRTTFPEKDGRPVQRIAAPGEIRIVQADLSSLATPLAEARRWAAHEARRPFDLERGPLLRLALLRLGEREHAVSVVVHHIVSDLWSMEILTREVTALYGAFTAERPSPLPELAIQFVDFASWQRTWLRGEMLEKELAYWRDRLRDGLEPLQLPTDRPRPAIRRGRGAQCGFELSRPLAEELGALASEEGTTLFSVVLGAFQVLLGRYTGDSAVSVGSPVAGRDRLETEDLIGFFINTLVLRTSLAGAPRFRQLLQRVRTTVIEAHDHQSVPLEILMDDLRPERELGYTPLFQVWLSFRDRPSEPLRTSGLTLDAEGVDHGAAKWDLALFMGRESEAIAGHFEYDRDLFDADTIERMIGHLEILLGGAVAAPQTRLSELPLLSPAERRQLVEEWNRPPVSFTESRRLHEIFQEQAARRPRATAVVCDVEALTYGELELRANQLARALRQRGVGADTPVGLLVERSLDLVVGILGVLKAGGSYVPLDPGHPGERLVHALVDSGARVLVARPALLAHIGEIAGMVVVDPADPELKRESGDPLLAGGVNLADSLAYVIYTSGSTGVPKGTPVSHAQVTRLFTATAPWFEFGPDQVWSLFHSFAFDFSVWELWGALLHGGSVVVVPTEVSRSPKAFYRLLAQEGVTVLSQTPSAFRQLVQADEEADEEIRSELRLRRIVFGGEALDLAMLRSWWQRHAEDRPRLINMYGITETTVHVTCRPLAPADLELPGYSPIGVPIRDLHVHVLDRRGRQVPAIVPGEICVGGLGVARGYLGRPGLTAERFVPDDLSGAAGARLYRSGDLGRWLASGELEYLGRIDHQVKVRGFRVELGEIETVLSEQPAIAAAAVLALPGEEGDVRLVAYVVPHPGVATLTLRDLRAGLGERLPEHMLPSAVVTLETLPLTPNGKVDRRLLADLKPEPAVSAGAWLEPATPLEEVLAGIWAAVLDVARVGRRDHFFDLGGHSLLATRVVSRIRQALGVEVPLLDLFEEPVLEVFAHRVEEALALRRPVAPPIVPVDRAERLPVSFSQQRLVVLERLEPDNCAYHLPLVARVRGTLEPMVLARTLTEIVRRHEVLRTAFVEDDGAVWQRVEPPPKIPLPVVDLRRLPEARRDREATCRSREAARRLFRLDRPPLLRCCLFRTLDEEHQVAVVLHHIVSDEWSHGLLLSEIAALYRAFLAGRSSPLSELQVQYGDFAVWQRHWLQGPVLDQLLEHWCSRLADVSALDLPLDRPRPAIQTFRGASRSLSLAAEMDARLSALARREGATPFMILLAAFRALLARYSGQDDIAVGTPIANRNRAEIEPLIGFFVNTLVLRVGVGGAPSFRDLVARERRTALEAFAHQDLPFERLVDALQPERNLARTPLFQVMFVLHNAPMPSFELPDATVTPIGVDTGTAKFDLTLFAGQREGRWTAILESNADLFDTVTVDRLGRHFRILLTAALASPERPVAELDLLAPSERHQLLEWAGEAPPSAVPPLAHLAIATWALRDPDAVALVSAGEELAFAELNRRANRLAHLLAARGVGPEVTVGVALERGIDLVVTLLGVLKAGGAYLPLDPAYPEERLVAMADAASTPLVIARSDDAERFAAPGRSLLAFDGDADLLDPWSDEDPEPRATAENLAYVLFTSGSSGRPKGVMISHKALAWYVAWAAEHYCARAGSGALLHTSVGFDLSVTSLFVPLAAGRRVVLAGEEEGGEGLAEGLRGGPLFSLVKLTPAHLEVLLQQLAARDAASAAQALVIGGEALTYERLAFWRRHAPKTRLINEYGPTETVVGCCLHEVAADEPATGAVPIGRPVPYARLRVFDRWLRVSPVRVAGELCIGGAALARGYLARPAATARAFVPDPLAATPGARLYRTGDLVCHLADGRLQFLGRIDQQVAIRGFRVEPGEIEAALAEQPGVRDAVVVPREDLPGHPRLVAYVAGGSPAVGASELRHALARRLPTYMIPAAFVVLSELPLTVHGKIDRARLPAPEDVRDAGRAAFEAPRTPVEAILAEVWCSVLHRERVGVHDNFFEIGGDSILALQIVTRAGEAGLRLTPRDVFQHQTIAALAEIASLAADSAVTDEEPVQAAAAGPIPLMPIQCWLFEQKLPDPHHHNQSVMLELLSSLDLPLLERALARLTARHSALRLAFRRQGASWLQTVRPLQEVNPAVARIDLSALTGDARIRALEAAAGQVQASLDLATAPLLRTALFDLGGDLYRLLIVAHHLIVDRVSWDVLLEDLEAVCLALGDEAEPELPKRTTEFAVWAERLAAHAATREAELSYWLSDEREALLRLPGARGEGPDLEARARTVVVGLSADETRILLQERLGELRCRIDEALLAALLWAFASRTGTVRLRIDLEGHGREDIGEDLDLTRTVGWFTSLYPVVLETGAVEDPVAVLRAVKERLRAVPGRGLGFGLLRHLHPSPRIRERLRRLPPAEVSFNYLGQIGVGGARARLWRGAAEARGPERSPRQPRPHRLAIGGGVFGGELQIGWTFDPARLEAETVHELARTFQETLRELSERREMEAEAVYVPTDFPDIDLSQERLDRIFGELEEEEG